MRFDPGNKLWTSALALAQAAVFVTLLAPAPAAYAQDDPTFSLSLGGFFTNRESKTKVDGDVSDGTPVDLEGDLGLEKSDTVFRVDAYWRFADKHRIDFSAFDLSRSASKRIQEEFTWEDTVYEIDTLLKSQMDLAVYKLAYTWAFLKNGRSFLGATAGLYVADIGAKLTATELDSRKSGGVTAPLPVIGLRGEYRFADRWSLRGSGEVFALEYGDYSGSLYDVFVGVDYSATDKVALGLGVNSVKLDVGIDKSNFAGSLDWRYDGAMVYLKFDF